MITSLRTFRQIVHVASLLISLLLLGQSPLTAQHLQQNAGVRVGATLDSLMSDEDTDSDKRITIEDPHVPGTDRGDKRFWLRYLNGVTHEVNGTYFLSNLL